MENPIAPRPPLQCSTGPFWALELEPALDAVAEAGFRDVELMITRDPRTHRPELPLKLAQERHLTIAAIHAPFLVLTRPVWGLNPIEKVRRGAHFCQEVGAGSMIVHPPCLWEKEYARWLQTEAEAFSEETGIKVVVETMYPKWIGDRSLAAYRWLRPQILAASARWVALDTSHLTIAREDIFEAYEVLAPKLANIHLSNNAGDGRDGHLELERGILPIDRFLGELRRTNYVGAVALELSLRRYLERPKELVEMLRRNRHYVEERLSARADEQSGSRPSPEASASP